MESIFWQCPQEMGAAGRFRRTKPSGQQKQESKILKSVQFEEPGEDAKLDDCRTEVDGEDSREQPHMRKEITKELRKVGDFKNMDEDSKKGPKEQSQKELT